VSEHETGLLGAYVLGVLDGDEWTTVQDHLAVCATCRREADSLRQIEAALGVIPPEAFLEGPPPDGEALLRRTLDQVRGERRAQVWWHRSLWALAAAVVAVAAVIGGTLVGRGTASSNPQVVALPTPFVSASGERSGQAGDPRTGVSMSVVVQPAAGWVRVHATVSGVPAGEQCRLFVIARDGSRAPAGSWLSGTSPATVDSAALTAPADVVGTQIETYAGEMLVEVPI
jgi:anti-sigma-K factor RskA